MEQHPVPQDISSFEFHLVGDMTLKQFAYFGSGLGLAYLIFILFSKNLPVLAWPLIILFALLGTAFAFLPIMERPLDHWLIAFFKAIFRPTQLIYQSKVLAVNNPAFGNRLNLYLGLQTNLEHPPKIAALPSPAQKTAPLPSKEQLKKTVELAKEAQLVQGRILTDEEKLNRIRVNAAQPGADPKFYIANFQEVLSELQELNKEAGSVSGELAKLAQTAPKPILANQAVTTKPNIVPSLTLTAIPNIINGIVTDSQSNYLEGAVVITHDRQGLPVRALKSNKLGQFIAATPLPNSVYTITVEKDDLVFDNVQIQLTDKVLPPIVVAAKKQERLVV